MAAINLWLILVVIVIAVALALALALALARVRHSLRDERIGGDRSKLEARIVRILEDITGHSFDQAHPNWLREHNGPILELDGFSQELGIALEVQGPGHIKPLPGESYAKYQKRVARDRVKRELCRAHSVHLITMDYRISLANVGLYLRSRLFDIGFLPEKPFGYIKELDMVPWERGRESIANHQT